MKRKDLNSILKPLAKCGLQSYLGKGVHTLGLLDWILRQTGRADIYVSTFSTSDAFLRGFYNLRRHHFPLNESLQGGAGPE